MIERQRGCWQGCRCSVFGSIIVCDFVAGEGKSSGNLEMVVEFALEVGEDLKKSAVEAIVVMVIKKVVIRLCRTIKTVEKGQGVNHIECRQRKAPVRNQVFGVIGDVEARAPPGEVRRLSGELMQRVGVGAAITVIEEATEEAILETEGIGDGNGGEGPDRPASYNLFLDSIIGLCRRHNGQ